MSKRGAEEELVAKVDPVKIPVETWPLVFATPPRKRLKVCAFGPFRCADCMRYASLIKMAYKHLKKVHWDALLIDKNFENQQELALAGIA